MASKHVFWLTVLTVSALWLSAAKAEQPHNIGKYEFLYTDGVYDYYGRLWSKYNPQVEDEPSLPDDVPAAYHVPPGGGPWCDPNNICYDPLSFPPIKLPDIVVVTKRVTNTELMFFLDSMEGEFAPGVPSNGVARFDDPGDSGDDSADDCEDSDLEDLLEGFSESEAQSIKDFLNSPAAQLMWMESLADHPVTSERLEQAGFLVPYENHGYHFMRAVEEPGANEIKLNHQTNCNVEVQAPLDSGAVFIHTHPFSEGERFPCWSSPGKEFQYGGGPSRQDRFWVGNTVGSPYGIVMDKDRIHVYGKNSGDDLTGSDGIERCGY